MYKRQKLGDGNIFVGFSRDQANGEFTYRNDNNTPYTPGDDYDAKRQNNSYQNTDALVKWKNENWTLEGAWKRNDRVLPYGAPGNDKPWSAPGATQLTDQWNIAAARRQKWGDLDWGFRFEYLEQSKKYDDPSNVIGNWTDQHNKYETSRKTVAIDGSLPIGERHPVSYTHLDVYKRQTREPPPFPCWPSSRLRPGPPASKRASKRPKAASEPTPWESLPSAETSRCRSTNSMMRWLSP